MRIARKNDETTAFSPLQVYLQTIKKEIIKCTKSKSHILFSTATTVKYAK